MNNAAAWLDAAIVDAPESLRHRMLSTLETTPGNNLATALANAAVICLKAAAADPSGNDAAIDLLAGDALFTHACAAAAEAGPDALRDFVSGLDAEQFQLMVADD